MEMMNTITDEDKCEYFEFLLLCRSSPRILRVTYRGDFRVCDRLATIQVLTFRLRVTCDYVPTSDCGIDEYGIETRYNQHLLDYNFNVSLVVI